MKELESRFERNENLVFRRINDETILVPIKNNVSDMGFIYNLNPVDALVWEHLDGQTPLANIKGMICKEFDVSPEEAEADLFEFVNQLGEIEAIVATT